jgi:hypothetical protein
MVLREVCPLLSMFTRTQVVALVVAIVGLASCTKYPAGVLVNASATAIEVRYAMKEWRADAAGPLLCALRSHLPQIRSSFPRGRDVGPASEWRPLTGVQIDETKCEVTFLLPAGTAAKVFENSLCNDHAKHRNGVSGAGYVPQFKYLVVTSSQESRTWMGWAAVERFERKRGGHCFFEYQ